MTRARRESKYDTRPAREGRHVARPAHAQVGREAIIGGRGGMGRKFGRTSPSPSALITAKMGADIGALQGIPRRSAPPSLAAVHAVPPRPPPPAAPCRRSLRGRWCRGQRANGGRRARRGQCGGAHRRPSVRQIHPSPFQTCAASSIEMLTSDRISLASGAGSEVEQKCWRTAACVPSAACVPDSVRPYRRALSGRLARAMRTAGALGPRRAQSAGLQGIKLNRSITVPGQRTRAIDSPPCPDEVTHSGGDSESGPGSENESPAPRRRSMLTSDRKSLASFGQPKSRKARGRRLQQQCGGTAAVLRPACQARPVCLTVFPGYVPEWDVCFKLRFFLSVSWVGAVAEWIVTSSRRGPCGSSAGYAGPGSSGRREASSLPTSGRCRRATY